MGGRFLRGERKLKKMDLVPINDDSQFKIGDTNTLLSFTTLLNGQPVELTSSDLSMFQIKNDQGFIQSAKARIEGSTAILNSKDLANLPVGQYQLELWHRNSNGTNDIYPDKGWLPFNVNENATGNVGKAVTSITLEQMSQELSDQIKKDVKDAVDQIPKPKDGSNGLDGNDGLTPTIMIGQVTQLTAGSMPTVTDTGGAVDHVFNFGIPKEEIDTQKPNYASVDMYKETGMYIGDGVNSDSPTPNRYTLQVIADDKGGTQLLIDIADGRAWTRGFSTEGEFTDWRQITQWN